MRLNEGLEKLGEKEVIGRSGYERGVFSESAIENVTLPSTLKRIEKETFYKCKNLRSVEIQNGVEYIGEECFKSSTIKSITLPSTLKRIEDETFSGCKNLENVEIPNGVEYIGWWCFQNSGIEEIAIPGSVTVIGQGAFSKCEVLKKVSFQSGNRLEKIEAHCFSESGV